MYIIDFFFFALHSVYTILGYRCKRRNDNNWRLANNTIEVCSSGLLLHTLQLHFFSACFPSESTPASDFFSFFIRYIIYMFLIYTHAHVICTFFRFFSFLLLLLLLLLFYLSIKCFHMEQSSTISKRASISL